MQHNIRFGPAAIRECVFIVFKLIETIRVSFFFCFCIRMWRRSRRQRRYGFDSYANLLYTLRYVISYNLCENISNSCGQGTYFSLVAECLSWMDAAWARNIFWGYVSSLGTACVACLAVLSFFVEFFFITRECYFYSRPCRARTGVACACRFISV